MPLRDKSHLRLVGIDGQDWLLRVGERCLSS